MGRPPALSVEAKELIAKGAYNDFTTRYGDYFVGGYVIGAEAAAMVSRRDASKETEEVCMNRLELHQVVLEVTSKDRHFPPL